MLTRGKRRVRWEKLIKAFCEGNVPGAEMARHMNLSHEELEELLDDEEIQRRLRTVMRIDRMRSEIFGGHWKTGVQTHLLRLVHEKGMTETARRACVDFLKSSGAMSARSRGRSKAAVPSSPPMPGAIDAEAFERMLRESGQDGIDAQEGT